MGAIYILSIGEYHHRKIIMVSEDVKLIAKLYVKYIQPEYEHPFVEVWKGNQCIGYFHDYEKHESKVKKALSKLGMGMK
jgi:hypothetical protein